MNNVEYYINEIASAFVNPINNIESLRCVRRADRIYMELVHEDSYVRYFDISGMDMSEVGILICNIVSNKPTKREIQDRVVKKEVRRLFKIGGNNGQNSIA